MTTQVASGEVVLKEIARARRQRVSILVSQAWREIATERGYRFDQFLGTSSHGTIAIISYLRANGL
jgi:hypothetical protein